MWSWKEACAGTGVTSVAPARDRTGSRPRAPSAVDALGGMWSYVLMVGRRSLPTFKTSLDCMSLALLSILLMSLRSVLSAV